MNSFLRQSHIIRRVIYRSHATIDPHPSDLAAALAPRLVDHMRNGHQKCVVNFKSPQDLYEHFDKVVGVPLELEQVDGPTFDNEELLKACNEILDHSVNTTSPLFKNQLYGTPDPIGVAGDWLVSVLNANSHTFEVAPVFTLMEIELLKKFSNIIGGDFTGKCEGLFVPGGAISNLYALQLARFRHCPEVKTKGNIAAPGLCAFTSDESHYSYKKSCSLMGLGSDNLIAVGTDESGALDPEMLRSALMQAHAEGKVPFFVGASSGTTVLGAFDPLDKLAEVVQEFNQATSSSVWLHVDGAWGGATLLSSKQRPLMRGIEKVDSYSTNPHKVIGAPLQCAFFITKHDDMLREANGTNAAYLFQPDKENTEMDFGDKTIQCGRKVDTLKLWLMWKSLGDRGIERRVDRLCELAEYMVQRINSIKDKNGRRCFSMVVPRSMTNVVFYFIPPSLRTSSKNPLADMDLSQLKEVAPEIKKRMQMAGRALIGFQPVKHYPNCWRMVFAGAKEDIMTEATVDDILDDIKKFGDDL